MVTAMHGQNQVTRNIAWFKKATTGPTIQDEESEADNNSVPGMSYPTSPMEDVEPARPPNTDNTPDLPVTGHSMITRSKNSSSQTVSQPCSAPIPEGLVSSHRYKLRLNPVPSQRLRDHVCKCNVSTPRRGTLCKTDWTHDYWYWRASSKGWMGCSMRSSFAQAASACMHTHIPP